MGREAGRRINDLRGESVIFRGGAVAIEVAEGAGEEVENPGAGAVVGVLGGGVPEEEMDGAAEVTGVDGEDAVEVAGAEGGEVGRPSTAADDLDEEGAKAGVGVGFGEAAAEGEGLFEEVGRHTAPGGVIAPAMGVRGAEGMGVEGGLHGGHRGRRTTALWMESWPWRMRR